MGTEIRRQQEVEIVEEQDFKQEELLEKYIAKMLYKQNTRKCYNLRLEDKLKEKLCIGLI